MLAGCQTTPETIPPDLSQAEMFQRAQEAVDNENWDLALRYYEEFVSRYSDNAGAVAEARYEIAFIAYKRGEYALAVERFEALIADYEADTSGALPDWPLVLSQRLLEIIAERQAQG